MTRPISMDQRGSVTIETAAVLPVVFVLFLAVLQGVGLVRDLLVVQEAARAGARAAATTTSDAAILDAVHDATGGLDVTVEITPAARGPGDLAAVTVHRTGRLGPLRPTVTGRAVVITEPGAGP